MNAPLVTFTGDWTKGITGNGSWKYLQAVSPDRFQLVTNQGRYCARVEVRPGDITSSGERAEVAVMSDALGNSIFENVGSGMQYYAYSVLLDPKWLPPAPYQGSVWGIIVQLHGPDIYHTNPVFSLQAQDVFSIGLRGGDLDINKTVTKYKLADDKLNLGEWVEFVFGIKFTGDKKGSVEIWRRNTGAKDFTSVLIIKDVPTLQYQTSIDAVVREHYWKMGLYRSKQTAITNILWSGGFVRGRTFDAVVAEAF
jgi:hypothetical protein